MASKALGHQKVTVTLSGTPVVKPYTRVTAGETMPQRVKDEIGTGTVQALVQVEGDKVRFRVDVPNDGTENPTTTVGLRFSPGDSYHYDGDLDRFAFIVDSTATGDAVLQINYTQDT
jgi:hypothetical protein